MHKKPAELPCEIRLWLRVKPAKSCLVWQGAASRGYGQIKSNNKMIYVHRFSYELTYGKIKKNKEMHHKCENKLCVNPAHLVALTRKEHARFNHLAIKKRCSRGHLFSKKNTILKNGIQRDCRICRRKRALDYYYNVLRYKLLKKTEVKRFGG